MGESKPTQALAKLLEESGAQIVLPNETIREAFAALEAENARLTAERDDLQADRERLEALESMLSVDFVRRWQKGANSLRQEIDAAKAGK